MKYILSVLLLIIVNTSSAQDTTLFKKNVFISNANPVEYNILYPLNYSSDNNYPIVIYLNDTISGKDEISRPLQLPAAFFDNYLRNVFPCFVITPKYPAHNNATKLGLSLIHDLSTRPDVDQRRIYLIGNRSGGTLALNMIHTEPDFFAAVAVFSPVADNKMTSVIKDNNLWIFDDIESVNKKQSLLFVDALRWQGGNPLYTELHVMNGQFLEKAFQQSDLLPWIFSHVKTKHVSTDNKAKLTFQDTAVGSVTAQRKWWDVLYYDLHVQPQFETRRMKGINNIRYRVTETNTNTMQIDLQQPLAIDSVVLDNHTLVAFTNSEHLYYLSIPKQEVNSEHIVSIYYSGIPHVAKSPPWDGGITWTRDSLNRPWIITSCQLTGASIWYPCKSHQGDEPDNGASISITVADTLMAVSNGKLISKTPVAGGNMTYKWTVVNSINSYGICFYVGKYIDVTGSYNGVAGDLPMSLWVLDYNLEKAQKYLAPNTKLAIASFERWLGPYPFYRDGVKVADVPYIGMEHQSAIAYGNKYKYGYKGKDISGTGWGMKYDISLVHELAHEWFGNSITTDDLADKWVHEGFAGYAEILYLEDQFGKAAATEYVVAKRKNIENKMPVIPRYGVNETGGADDYAKGRAIVHMIRHIINDDEKFHQLLLEMNKVFYHKITDTKEIESFINHFTGIDFTPVFKQYLHTTQVPVVEYTVENKEIKYRYTNCNPDFSMPLKVKFGKTTAWIKPVTKWQTLQVAGYTGESVLEIDNSFYVSAKRIDSH